MGPAIALSKKKRWPSVGRGGLSAYLFGRVGATAGRGDWLLALFCSWMVSVTPASEASVPASGTPPPVPPPPVPGLVVEVVVVPPPDPAPPNPSLPQATNDAPEKSPPRARPARTGSLRRWIIKDLRGYGLLQVALTGAVCGQW